MYSRFHNVDGACTRVDRYHNSLTSVVPGSGFKTTSIYYHMCTQDGVVIEMYKENRVVVIQMLSKVVSVRVIH